MASVTTSSPEERTQAGLVSGLTAYLLWGFLPLLFDKLRHVGATTLVADRTLWSLLLVGAILIIAGRTAEVRAILRDWRTVRSWAWRQSCSRRTG